MKTCHCGCKEPVDRKGKRFSQKNHRIKWANKLSDRGVLPVWAYKHCLYCGCLLILFPKTRSRKVCDSSECQQAKKHDRIKKSMATSAKKVEIKKSMTKQTPYRYGTAPVEHEMRQRVRDIAGI